MSVVSERGVAVDSGPRPPGSDAPADRAAAEPEAKASTSSRAPTAAACPSFGFPAEARIKRRRDFLRIQGRGRRLHGARFIYYVRPGATARSRIGITTSRKVGNAVTRNRIRRWVREVFRQHPDLFRGPYDIVVIAKRGVEDFSYATIRDEFHHVFMRHARQLASGEAPGPRRGGGRSRGGGRRRGGRRRGGGAGGGGAGAGGATRSDSGTG